jgi:hypothetical protein
MTIYLSVVTIIFGPLLLCSFIRYLAKRVRRNVPKSPPLPPKRVAKSQAWARPDRSAGVHWRN